MNRRKFLSASGAGFLAALAGCSSDGKTTESPTEADPPGNKAEHQVSPPQANLPDGWELTTPDTEPHVLLEDEFKGIVDYTAIGHSRRFENKRLRKHVYEETKEKFDRPLVVGFANHVELDVGGDLTKKIVMAATDEVKETAKSEFEKELDEFGLEDIREEETIEISGIGEPSEFTKYTGIFSIDSIPLKDVDIPDVDRTDFELEGGKLKVAGLIATWEQNSNIFVAGGVYPEENYTKRKDWEITDIITLSLNVNLGFQPFQHRQNIIDFVQSIHI